MRIGTGRLLGLLLLGAWASGLAHELTVRDTLGRDWANERIVLDIAGADGVSALVKRDGKPIPAQVVPTPASVQILFVIDQLVRDGVTAVTAELGQTGPVDTDLTVAESEDGSMTLANGLAATAGFLSLLHAPDEAARPTLGDSGVAEQRGHASRQFPDARDLRHDGQGRGSRACRTTDGHAALGPLCR